MQVTMDQYSVSRRPLDVEDYLAMIRRNKSWILGPLLGGLTAAVIVAFFWPDTYISVAAIRVVPPQVPEKIVASNVNLQMAERVQAMQQTILSRNTLTNIIQTYDLYRRERSRVPMEDIIEKMRRDVRVGAVSPMARTGARNDAVAFQIAFAYENRYVAQKVTRDLMTRFIDENIRERFSQSQQTTQFLRDEYAKAKAELDGLEQKFTQFRIANAGRLPDSFGANSQQMTALEARISSLNSSISRAKQEQYMVEQELRAVRERMANTLRTGVTEAQAQRQPGTPAADPAEAEMAALDHEIQKLERVLERMLEQYKPTYPDVRRLEVRLKSMRKEREDLLNKRLAVRDPVPGAAGAAPQQALRLTPQAAKEVADLETLTIRLQGHLRAKEMEIERYVREIGDADRRSKEVQARLELSPLGEAQLAQFRREHEIAKKTYDDLKHQLTASERASEVENRKQGETLEVLDLPSLPETPTDPKRVVIIAVGVVIGLALGFSLAAFRELKDTSLKSLKDVRAYTQFNVLGSIPLLENDLVVRRRRRIALLSWTSACVLSVAAMAGSIYYYFSTKL